MPPDSQTFADTAWMDFAHCRESDPELFFPTHSTNTKRSRGYALHVGEARLVCQLCGVRMNCLTYALDRPWLEGIWAGTTPEDRRRIRKQRAGKNAPHPKVEGRPLPMDRKAEPTSRR